MKAPQYNIIFLSAFCLFINSFIMAQETKIVSDKIASFSDPRVPEKLIENIKDLNLDSTNEYIFTLKGKSSKTDTIFFNSGTVKYNWDISFDTTLGRFTGVLNQIAYIKSNNFLKRFQKIENNFILDIQEEIYCCTEKPDICCLWSDRKKYRGCTWIVKTTK